MMGENLKRVWRPLVEPNQTKLPQPGALTSNLQQEFYTTTSLVSSEHQPGDNEFKQLRNLNNKIVSSAQAFNSTPKPFLRQESSETPKSRQESSQQSKYIAGKAQSINHMSLNQIQQQEHCRIDTGHPKSLYQEENMAPKLVHKQYNSPIDLYSMNNIRKTIEAHTELLAPGIKGINFMKAEAPVNKQSEVYKLVMEEEQRARSNQGTSSRLSPISGQPVNLPREMVDKSEQKVANQASEFATQQFVANLSESNREVEQQKVVRNGTLNDISGQQQSARSSVVPVCCECGQFIHSAFAKIQNRFIHPQCFNCTTCGTSLKNTGYFTINEKLYCDIHAKQVANLMHIEYDFDDHKSKISTNQHQSFAKQSTSELQQSTLTRQQEHQQANLQKLSSQDVVNRHPEQQQKSFTSVSSSPATISTMFADRSCLNNSSTNEERQEIRWTWRPATSKDQTSSPSPCSNRFLKQEQEQARGQLSPESYGNRPTLLISQQQQQQQQQQQSTMSMGIRSLGLLRETSSVQGGRLPVCTHCHSQIQGPYILAGKTTWCKSCSQTNFNCNSCRRSLLDNGFIEDDAHKYFCESCFEAYYAPICSKCNIRIKGDCLNALGKQWHPSCFVCGHCRRPFGNSSFYLEDNLPYCERDWNVLFTTKCYSCSYPIEAGDKWIDALDRNYHSNCFKCTSCQANLEGSTFYCKNGKPYCRLHAR